MRPILAQVLEQWGQDNAVGRTGAMETLLARALCTSRLYWGCLDPVLLVGSGSLRDSTTPSWPVLSEGIPRSRIDVKVLHGDFQVVPEAFILAAIGGCSSLQFTIEDTLWETFI